MRQPAKMKPIFFIFLFLIPFVYSYYPGESISLPYNNITDVDYPCEMINGTIYLAGDIGTGNIECTVYYLDVYTLTSNHHYSGGGYYIQPKPKNITKNATVVIPAKEVKPTEKKPEVIIPAPNTTEVVDIPTNTTINTTNITSITPIKKEAFNFKRFIIIFSIGALALGIFIYFNRKNDGG